MNQGLKVLLKEQNVFLEGGAVAKWYSVEFRIESSGIRFSLRSPCCILQQDTFSSPKVLVIPKKRWLRPDMTQKC